MSSHGDANRYNQGCRCIPCTAANTIHQREMAARRSEREIPQDRHGTASCYTNYRCRCPECCAANSDYQAKYRAKVAAQ